MHIEVTYDPANPENTAIILDGHDITKAVCADGFGIEFPGHATGRPIVTMRLMAHRLNVTLPDALVHEVA